MARKLKLVVVAAAMLSLWLLAGCGPPPEAQSQPVGEPSAQAVPIATPGAASPSEWPKIGSQALDFLLPTPEGKMLRLSDLRGKPVFVNFWATWCAPCRQEMPIMQKIYEERQKDGLVIVAVNLRERPEQVLAFGRELGLTFTFVLDKDQKVTEGYQILGLPSSFFVDRNGVIRAVKFGAFASKREIEFKLESIMRR